MKPMDPWHGRIELSPAHMAQVQVLSGLHHFKSEIVVILKKVALCAHNQPTNQPCISEVSKYCQSLLISVLLPPVWFYYDV